MSRVVLVTGARGLLGRAVEWLLRARGEAMSALARADLDIADATAVETALRSARADVVINAAALTDVDAAERDPARAFAVNADGPRHLAQAAARAGARFVHVSTDYVFDGQKGAPYEEDDEPRPLSVYGASKLAGERAVLDVDPRALVVRTSWLFGPSGRGFLSAVFGLAAEPGRAKIEAVADQVGSPTAARHAALGIAQLVEVGATGIVHLGGQPPATRFDFAMHLAALLWRRGDIVRAPAVVPVRAADVARDGGAPRPGYSALACGRYERLTGERAPDWRRGIEEVLASSASARRVEDGGTSA